MCLVRGKKEKKEEKKPLGYQKVNPGSLLVVRSFLSLFIVCFLTIFLNELLSSLQPGKMYFKILRISRKLLNQAKIRMLIFKSETLKPKSFQYKIAFKYDVWKLPLAPSPCSPACKGAMVPRAAGLPKEIRFTVRVGDGKGKC